MGIEIPSELTVEMTAVLRKGFRQTGIVTPSTFAASLGRSFNAIGGATDPREAIVLETAASAVSCALQIGAREPFVRGFPRVIIEASKELAALQTAITQRSAALVLDKHLSK